jgi:hypothetical protein
VARLNIERNRHRLKCQDVEIVTADATKYEIPNDLTIAYFFSPFTGEAFERVIDNLVESPNVLPEPPHRLRQPSSPRLRRRHREVDLVRKSKGLRRNIESKWIYAYAGQAGVHARR